MILIATLIVINSFRTKGSIARALNMSLFSIVLPRETQSSNGPQKQDKELIMVMEQLYSSFTNIHSKGWNKFEYGEPYLSFEMAVHHIGEEIHFYASVPRSFEDIFEKLVHGLYPTAEVAKVKDYNIFNPNGAHVGGYMALKGDAILPFKTYQSLESDPLGLILTAFSKLDGQGEGASMQILIRPSHEDSARKIAGKVARDMQNGAKFSSALSKAQKANSIFNIFFPAKKDENKPAEGPKQITQFDQEVIKSIQTKASKPLFDTDVRVIVSSTDQSRAEQIFNEISNSFVQLSSSDANSVKMNKLKGSYLNKLLFKFAFRVFDNRQSILLSSEELASLMHFPLATTSAPKVKYLNAKPSEPPSDLPREGIVLGVNVYRGQETPVHMPDEDRRRHLYVIGQTGTGKTTILKSLLRQDIENGKGLCLIDPHGEFSEFVLGIIPKERIDDVIYFDPGDISRPMGLNMMEFDPNHSEQKSMVIDELFGIFDKLYDLKTTGGPMFEKYFKNSALLLMDAYEHAFRSNLPDKDSYIPVLADVSRVLVDDAYRAKLLTMEMNPLVSQFWKLEAEKAGGDQSLANMAPYITSKITSFVFNEFLRPVINQPKSAFNFREVMDNGKILVVNLSQGKLGEINAALLGMIVIGKLLMAALSRVDIVDEKQRKDFYLYIDEFQNFSTDSISKILSEARKYRLSLIIAHQFVKQLKENIRNAIFGKVGSIFALRLGPDDAEDPSMKNKFAASFTPQDMTNIANLNAYVSLILNNKVEKPFSLRLETEKVFGAGSREMFDAINNMSKLKYGRPRDEVEAEIKAKFDPVK